MTTQPHSEASAIRLRLYCSALAVGLTWLVGCNSDTDSEGETANQGGGKTTTTVGGRGGTTSGSKTSAITGGTAAVGKGGTTAAVGKGGAVGVGGSGNGGQSAAINAGAAGRAQGGTYQTFAGSTSDLQQGGAGAAASSGTAVAGSTSTSSPCPGPVVNAGALVTPPSNGFELEMRNWATTSEDASALTRKSASDACEGSSYVTCAGGRRAAAWDGPKLDIYPYLIPGHVYAVTMLARFSPQNAPSSAANVIFTSSKVCIDSSVGKTYTVLDTKRTATDWIRLSGSFDTKLAGCSELAHMTVYLNSEDANANNSLDIDEFQLWDLSPATGTGGAAGASGVAGAAGKGGAGAAGQAGLAGNAGAAGTAGGGAAGNLGNNEAGVAGR